MQEKKRLEENKEGKINWKKWGPYVTDRQWGTVREDYSEYGTAWEFVSHDAARSKAYRWGEEGIAGISDDQQLLCFALALWNVDTTHRLWEVGFAFQACDKVSDFFLVAFLKGATCRAIHSGG